MVIRSIDDLSPELLNGILSHSGVLKKGRVVRVEAVGGGQNTGFVSEVESLAVGYSDDAQGDLPGRVFLKLSKEGVHPEIMARNRREVLFFREAEQAGGKLAIPRCYSAEVDESGWTHILMQDYTESHYQKPLPIPPSNRSCESMVEALAELHAVWWNNPRLGNGFGDRPTREGMQATRTRLENTYPGYAEFLGDALPEPQREIYAHILGSGFLSSLEERLLAMRDVTLVHGDPHQGNFMLPRDADRQGVVLIDWHLWDFHLGTNDLAFLIALHWSPQRRAFLERGLLERYYRVLCLCGVSGYGWDDFWDDYRRSVVLMTLIPIGQYRRGQAPGIIWHGLQDSMAAFVDLGCEEVL